MDCSSLYQLVNTGRNSVPNDHEAARLFDANHMAVDNLTLDQQSSKRVNADTIFTEQELESRLSSIEKQEVSFFLLRQKNSWSRIQLSFRGFQTLLRSMKVFPEFWGLVKGFGLKFEPEDEYSIDYKTIFHRRNKLPSLPETLEMTYSVRYFDRNDRPNTKALWSERHVAIYHQLNIADLISRWIIIQGSAGMRSGLSKFFSSAEKKAMSLPDHLQLHLLFLLELSSNWRSYANFLESQLNELDEKALHSRDGRDTGYDYDVTLRDTQNLERVRRKLAKAAFILQANASVGRSLRSDFVELAIWMPQADFHHILHIIYQYTSSLERHERVIRSLLDRSDGTRRLLFQLLEHKTHEVPIRMSIAIRAHDEPLEIIPEEPMETSEVFPKKPVVEAKEAISEPSVVAKEVKPEEPMEMSEIATHPTRDIQNYSQNVKIVAGASFLYTSVSLTTIDSGAACRDGRIKPSHEAHPGSALLEVPALQRLLNDRNA